MSPDTTTTVSVAPSRTANQSFVIAAVHDILGRAPTTAELATDSVALDHGGSRAALVKALEGSNERITSTVRGLYQSIVGYAPSTSRQAYWVGQLGAHHVPSAALVDYLYASDAYYATRGGNSTSKWVTSLYTRMLHRPGSAANVAAWVKLVQTRGRTSVAHSFYQGGESRTNRVNTLYQSLLQRLPDVKSRNHWATVLATSDDASLVVYLVPSSEYFRKAAIRFP